MDNETAEQKFRQATELFQGGEYHRSLGLLDELAAAFPNNQQLVQARSAVLKATAASRVPQTPPPEQAVPAAAPIPEGPRVRSPFIEWARETGTAEAILVKAVVLWVVLLGVGSAIAPILFIVHIIGATPNLVRAVYSGFITVPTLVVFQLNALVYLPLALCGVDVDYNGMLYRVAHWVEDNKVYEVWGK